VNIDGASFLIAGASGGLGRGLATELHRRGAALTLVARRPDGLEDIVPGAATLAADLRLPDSAERAVDRAVELHGRLDGVVNAAGVVAFGDLVDTDPDVIEELMLTNTLLPAFLFREAIPRMEHGGVLVNLSGVVAEQPVAGMAAYSASKAAAHVMLAAVRREVRRRKIRVLDARPGHTETGLADRPIAGQAPRFPDGHDPREVARRIVEAIAEDETDLPPDAF
jgi:cyclic-di-GMP-binding biofilm dispersal mediator protein